MIDFINTAKLDAVPAEAIPADVQAKVKSEAKTKARDKRKNAKAPLIRIPASMKTRVERLRDELQASDEAGRIELPDGIDCERIPLWHVLERALNELEDHRFRSKKSRKNSKTAKSAKPEAKPSSTRLADILTK